MNKHCLLILFLLITFNTHAAIYKWTDKSGKIHYSSTPPPQEKTQVVKPSYSKKSHQKALQEVQNKNKQFKDRRDKQKKEKSMTAKEIEVSKRLKENCKQAKENLKGFQNPANRFYLKDKKRIEITDEIRKQRIDTANKAVKDNCK